MTITGEELYKIWAPPESHWARWAKPALFAQLASVPPPTTPLQVREISQGKVPESDGRTVIIVDLPGAESVLTGAALAMRGYRPIPLFNAVRAANEIVDQDPIIAALSGFADELSLQRLPPDAPPAFLLDAARIRTADGLPRDTNIVPGVFDNRWLTMPQDFPSAKYLRERGILNGLLIMNRKFEPQDDLCHVLLRWQQGDIRLSVDQLDDSNQPAPLAVRTPSHFRSMYHRTLVLLGLRKNSAGGFGGTVPTPSAG